MQRLATKPLVTIRSPLGEIDRVWLQEIEPKLYRPAKGHEAFGCWLWQGRVDNKGEPVHEQYHPIKKKRSTRVVKKTVAAIFVIGWNDKWFVFHECGNKNCVAPHHLLFTKSSDKQFDLAPYVKSKQKNLRDYRAEALRSSAISDLTADVEGEINA